MTAQQLTDETAFAEAVERHRRELQVHCYRMLGSFEESEDLTQETFLRAWRRRETYEARASVRAWLYRIATNACLDALERRPRKPVRRRRDRLAAAVSRRAAGGDPGRRGRARRRGRGPRDDRARVHGRDPAPGAAPARGADPARHPRLAREGDGRRCSGRASRGVNSALQRARAGLKEHLPEQRLEWAAPGSPEERALVARYIETHRDGGHRRSGRADPRGRALLDAARGGALHRSRHDGLGAGSQGGFGDPGVRRLPAARDPRQPPAGARELRAHARARASFARSRSTCCASRAARSRRSSRSGRRCSPAFGLPLEL